MSNFAFIIEPPALVGFRPFQLIAICEEEDPAAFIEEGPGGPEAQDVREFVYRAMLIQILRPLEVYDVDLKSVVDLDEIAALRDLHESRIEERDEFVRRMARGDARVCHERFNLGGKRYLISLRASLQGVVVRFRIRNPAEQIARIELRNPHLYGSGLELCLDVPS